MECPCSLADSFFFRHLLFYHRPKIPQIKEQYRVCPAWYEPRCSCEGRRRYFAHSFYWFARALSHTHTHTHTDTHTYTHTRTDTRTDTQTHKHTDTHTHTHTHAHTPTDNLFCPLVLWIVRKKLHVEETHTNKKEEHANSPQPCTTIQKLGAKYNFNFMFSKEVSYAHQGCKYSKNSVI